MIYQIIHQQEAEDKFEYLVFIQKYIQFQKKQQMEKLIFLLLLSILYYRSDCCPGRVNIPSTMTIIEPSDDPAGRRLLSQLDFVMPHPLKIYGEYLSSTRYSNSFQVLKATFQVAVAYYQRIIKVVPLPFYMTRFRINNPASKPFLGINLNPCTPLIDPKYIINGFDQNLANMVILIDTQNITNDSNIVEAVGCQFESRLLYGLLTFNLQSDIAMNPLFAFHKLVQTTVLTHLIQLHQLTHILGFSSQFFSLFSQSPFLYKRMPLSKVLLNYNNRSYIITPNVLSYVRSYFNCRDTTSPIGALLQNQGPPTLSSNHWQQLVYKDQLMVAANWLPTYKITKLTLALLRDTNFYAEVDDSFVDTVYYGSGRGCAFARGDEAEFRDQCEKEGGLKSCDYYGGWERECRGSGFSDGVKVEKPAELVCVGEGREGGGGGGGMYFGEGSRCFSSSVNNNGYCLKASCDQQRRRIAITFGNQTKYCTKSGESLSIDGHLINCPKNLTVFCSVKSCPDWCNGRGMCVGGKCVCMDPFKGEACEEGCENYFDDVSNRCVSKCPNGTFTFGKKCVERCPSQYMPNDLKQCEFCQGCERELEMMMLLSGDRVVVLLIFILTLII